MCVRSECSVLFLLLIVCSGCSTLSRAGYGDRGTFNDGVLTTRFEQDLGITYDVTIKALADLDAKVLDASKDEHHALIKAAGSDNAPVIVITFIWRRHDTTGATIKVGEQGDESYSSTVVDAIDKRLSEWRRQNYQDSARPGRPSMGD